MSKVVATIPVGGWPSGIAIADRRKLLSDIITGRRPRGPFVFVANNGGDSVSVIRVSDNSVVRTIPGIDAAVDVKISANGARAYVLRVGGITVVDTGTHNEVGWIDHGSGLKSAFAVSSDKAELYIIDGNAVSVVDYNSAAVTATIPVGGAPVHIELSPDGARAYTANVYSDDVSVIDRAAQATVATIGVDGEPTAVAVSPDSARVYVTNAKFQRPTGTVSVIDAATNAVTHTIPVGSSPMAIALSPNGKHAFVANYTDGVIMKDGKVVGYTGGTISIIDTDINKVVETVKVGNYPTGVAVTPDGAHVYVSNGEGTVSVVKIESDLKMELNKHIAELLGAVDRDGGGWIILGNKVVPIPPRSPSVAVAAKAAAAHYDGAVEDPEIAEHLRRLTNRTD
ncbi:MAG TPA: YncE family protein [Mycobacterium sp.]|nr:YncE family protein [Mycobacterium sp.]